MSDPCVERTGRPVLVHEAASAVRARVGALRGRVSYRTSAMR